jgi:hypothetical protein
MKKKVMNVRTMLVAMMVMMMVGVKGQNYVRLFDATSL